MGVAWPGELLSAYKNTGNFVARHFTFKLTGATLQVSLAMELLVACTSDYTTFFVFYTWPAYKPFPHSDLDPEPAALTMHPV